jgi:hypothetical protein
MISGPDREAIMRRIAVLGALLGALVLATACEEGGTRCGPDVSPSGDVQGDLPADPGDPGDQGFDAPGDPGADIPANVDVAVVPERLDLGKVRLGCLGGSGALCVVNRGPAVAVDFDLSACDPQFRLKSADPLVTLPAGGEACVRVAFAAAVAGDATCTIRVTAGDPAVTLAEIPVTARGVDGDWRTDTFRVVSGQAIDLLFVVDDSPSMCAHAGRVLDAFDAFAGDGAIWKADFHVGVAGMGGDRPGTLRAATAGTRPWLARGDDPTALRAMADLGCDGSSDGAEAGFDAIRRALSHPGLTVTDQPCEADADCCGGAEDCPYLCTDSRCGGPNAGFLREDAQLEIVVISDGDDHSDGEVGPFTDFLKSLKGYYNANMMHLNAVVSPGPEPCTVGELAAAEVGARWAEAATQTGGMQGSICDDPLALFRDIGQACFTPKVQYFLTALAEPATIAVKVGEAACLEHWRYDAPSNSVIFDHQDPADPCSTPPEGVTIEVRYRTLCLTA